MGFVKRLGEQLDRRGTVDVLRRGVVDRNVRFQLGFLGLRVVDAGVGGAV